MVKKTLGISLGVDSVGWAVVSSENEIKGMGVRVFSPGTQNLGQGEREQSNKAFRRMERVARKNYYRTRLRKQKLLLFLIKNNMCPLSLSDVERWKQHKEFPEKECREWFAMNPYELRKRAAYEKVSLHELGRILYHLSQRRGFSSAHSRFNPTLNVLKYGNPIQNTLGMQETQKHLKDKTLGEYLYTLHPEKSTSYKKQSARIRNRYTDRGMYVFEFNVLYDTQKQYHPELTEEIKQELGVDLTGSQSTKGLLFYQRPLRSKKHLVGNCLFEHQKTKAPASCPEYEMLKIYKWVNSIRCNNRPLTENQKKLAIQIALKFSRFSFLKVRKALQKVHPSSSFNYFDNDVQTLSHTVVNLSKHKFFGDRWFEFSEKEQEDIWHVLYFFDDKKKLKEYAIKNWGFSQDSAKEISEFTLQTNYSEMSRKAIRNILFFLKRSVDYELAIVLGGIKSSLGHRWSRLKEGDIDALIYSVVSLYNKHELYGFIPAIQNYLRDEYQFSEKQLRGLYGISSQNLDHKPTKFLPVTVEEDKAICAFKRPLFVTAIFQLRKVINKIIEKHGSMDRIKVSISPELKASRPQRKIIYSERKRKIEESTTIKQKVLDLGKNPTFLNITKLQLWEESKGFCPYTGKEISLQELFSSKISVVYIRPWERFLNDSHLNRSLCKTNFKKHIEGLTPYEFFGSNEKYDWEEIKARTAKIFASTTTHPNSYEKFKHFVLIGDSESSYLTEMNDQHHLSLEVQCYLNKICTNVLMSSGFVNNRLREKWEITLPKNEGRTSLMEDHRLHSLHALTTACAEVSYLNILAHWNRFEVVSNPPLFPKPWEHFDKDAEQAINQIVVSHQKQDRILTTTLHKIRKRGVLYRNKGVAARGSLHKETFYGKRKTSSAEAFHLRKPLQEITTLKQINRIVDPVIKKLVLSRIQSLGGFVKDKVPKKAFFTKTKKGKIIPKIFLPNRNGDPVPVMKVRLRVQVGNAVQLKTGGNKYVNPRNNHHVLIYKDRMGNFQQSIVTFWEVVERKRNGFPVVSLPDDGETIITTLQINDCFILGMDSHEIDWDNLDNSAIKDHIYRVQRLSSNFYEFRRVFDANIKKTRYPDYVRILNFGHHKTGWMTYTPIKIKVNPIGEISKFEISHKRSLYTDISDVVLNA